VIAPGEKTMVYPRAAQMPSEWVWMKKQLPAQAAPHQEEGGTCVSEQDSYVKAVNLLLL